MNEETVFSLGGMVFVLVILGLITVIAVVVITKIFKYSRTKTATMAEITRDEAYRKLAEEAIAVQRRMAEDQQRITKDISEIKKSVDSMERMLREVE